MSDAMSYICRFYSVPAKKGGRVSYTGDGAARLGTITGADGAHLMIRLDGARHAAPFHPTWELAYLDAEVRDAEIRQGIG